MGDLGQARALVAAAADRFGAVDILVNSASIWQSTPLPMGDFSGWHRVLGVLLNGSMYLADAVAPLMLERGEGAIVNIVDLSAWTPFAGYVAHSVGKAGLLALTRQLAVELAPAVSVNAVAPGPVLPPPDPARQQIARTAQPHAQRALGHGGGRGRRGALSRRGGLHHRRGDRGRRRQTLGVGVTGVKSRSECPGQRAGPGGRQGTSCWRPPGLLPWLHGRLGADRR